MNNTRSITQNRDFLRIYRRGKSQVHPLLVTYVSRNRLGSNRLGMTASKKVGGAVQRNRARRVIREAYRLLEPRLALGWDIVFVARTKTTLCTMDQVKAVMERQLAALSLLSAPEKQ